MPVHFDILQTVRFAPVCRVKVFELGRLPYISIDQPIFGGVRADKVGELRGAKCFSEYNLPIPRQSSHNTLQQSSTP